MRLPVSVTWLSPRTHTFNFPFRVKIQKDILVDYFVTLLWSYGSSLVPGTATQCAPVHSENHADWFPDDFMYQWVQDSLVSVMMSHA
jgi:hypothetical protein